MRAHCENAERVVETLRRHELVSRTFFPGLADHPGHAIAAAQQDAFGAMVSFEIRGGFVAIEQFVAALQCFTLAESLGGVESLIAHPASMTHASMDEAARANAGISDSLLRLSVGIEDVEDLIDDITSALDTAAAGVLVTSLSAAKASENEGHPAVVK
jgi:cystathionine gamma-synthase